VGWEAGHTVICQSIWLFSITNQYCILEQPHFFIDSEIETWNLCPLALEETIIDSGIAKGKKPKKVIVLMHLYSCHIKLMK
jgi:dTDP-4-amino-4,6-dideoxygalactose transaminase